MTDAAAFWDKIAPKYAQDPIKDQAAYEYTLERTTSYLTEDSRVLEIGCGTGSTAIALAPFARSLIGTDLSPVMVGIAAQKATDGNNTNVEFRVMDAQSAAQLYDPVDVVTAFNLFHLVRNAEDIFSDIHSRLPVDGLFISKTPCVGDPSFGIKRFFIKPFIGILRLLGKAPYVRSFRNDELEAAIKFAGFEIIEAGNFPSISRYIVARKR